MFSRVVKAFTITVLFIMMSANSHGKDLACMPADFGGMWYNDMGSVAEVKISDGVVSGTYRTSVGQPDKSQSFPLVGLVQGDQITFTVNFKGYGSMTAWVGQLVLDDTGRPYIRTLWHLTKDIEDAKEKDDIWGSIRTGASAFRRKQAITPP